MFSSMFGVAGIALLAIGVFVLLRKRRFVAGAARTSGTVVGHEARTTPSHGEDDRTVQQTLYHSIFEFKDARGAQRRVTSPTGGNPQPYAEGTAVTVLFDPHDPDRAEIESFGQQWLLPAILLGLGTVFTAIAIGSALIKG